MATQIVVLLLGGLKLILGPGVFTVFDLHKMDVTVPLRNSSRPDAISVTPHPTNPNRPPTPPSNR
eukprot:1150300-Pelagomonas_calceolata.AAC.5